MRSFRLLQLVIAQLGFSLPSWSTPEQAQAEPFPSYCKLQQDKCITGPSRLGLLLCSLGSVSHSEDISKSIAMIAQKRNNMSSSVPVPAVLQARLEEPPVWNKRLYGVKGSISPEAGFFFLRSWGFTLVPILSNGFSMKYSMREEHLHSLNRDLREISASWGARVQWKTSAPSVCAWHLLTCPSYGKIKPTEKQISTRPKIKQIEKSKCSSEGKMLEGSSAGRVLEQNPFPVLDAMAIRAGRFALP